MTSILFPLKQYGRKLTTKYDPKLHQPTSKFTELPDLYPLLRDAEFVDLAVKKRKTLLNSNTSLTDLAKDGMGGGGIE